MPESILAKAGFPSVAVVVESFLALKVVPMEPSDFPFTVVVSLLSANKYLIKY